MNTEHAGDQELALHLSGDLTPDMSRLIEEHLEECALCREALAEFERTQQLLKDFFHPSEEDLSDVRQRVLSRLPRRSPRWRISIAAAAAIAGLCLLEINLHRVSMPAPVIVDKTAQANVPPTLQEHFPAPRLKPRVAPVARTLRHRAAPGLRSVSLIAQAEGPPIIKMITSDPNVIILWQTRETQSTEESEPNE